MLGSRRVACKLGELFLEGEELDKDLALAEKWLLHAANDGISSACWTLGREYASGSRFRQDVDAATHWLKLAAQSSKSAGFDLAAFYTDGKIVPVDFDEALKWLRHATASDHFQEEALKCVTEKFCDGQFSTEQEAAAIACLTEMVNRLRIAVSDEEDLHFPHRAFRLGKHYELGIGVQSNLEEAIHWYKVAAKAGLWGAKKRLGELGIEWDNN